jgi:hypothetical protein
VSIKHQGNETMSTTTTTTVNNSTKKSARPSATKRSKPIVAITPEGDIKVMGKLIDPKGTQQPTAPTVTPAAVHPELAKAKQDNPKATKQQAMKMIMGSILHGESTVAELQNAIKDCARLLKIKMPKIANGAPVEIKWDDAKALGFTGKFAGAIEHLLAGKSTSEAAKANGHGDRVNPVRDMLRRILEAKGIDYLPTARLGYDAKAKGIERVTVHYAQPTAKQTKAKNTTPKPEAGKAYPERFTAKQKDHDGGKAWVVTDGKTGTELNGGFMARTEEKALEFCKLFDKLVTFPQAALTTLANGARDAKTSDEKIMAKGAESLLKALANGAKEDATK